MPDGNIYSRDIVDNLLMKKERNLLRSNGEDVCRPEKYERLPHLGPYPEKIGRPRRRKGTGNPKDS